MSSNFAASTHPANQRANRRCGECNRSIEVGERYERTAGSWYGDFFTNVACSHCAAARRIVRHNDAEYNEVYYGGLSEWMADAGLDEAWSLRLRAQFCARWRFQSGSMMAVPS